MTEANAAHPDAGAQCLLERFDEHLVGLIQYGSTVFGQPRRGSVRDFWVIVRDAAAFHHSRAMHAIHRANGHESVAVQIRWNMIGPSFYAIEGNGLHMKIAVIGLDTFTRLCRSETYLVKGRMQKPLHILRTCPEIDAAIRDARSEAAAEALDLVPRRFTLGRYLYCVLSLSYRAEIRPEMKKQKINSILAAGRRQVEEIYRPMLEALPIIVKLDGGRYLDRRHPIARRRAKRTTKRRLLRIKYSRRNLYTIWKNYSTHARPIRYIYLKIRGEAEKLLRRKRGDTANIAAPPGL